MWDDLLYKIKTYNKTIIIKQVWNWFTGKYIYIFMHSSFHSFILILSLKYIDTFFNKVQNFLTY